VSCSHSFGPDFYGDPYNASQYDRPTTLADALASMPDEQWNEMCQNLWPNRGVDCIDLEFVFVEAINTNTVTNLCSPAEVWINSDGNWTVKVYE